MRIAVVGAGAMGSVYAGLLAEAGHDVVAVDRWREHVEAIAARGLRVEGASGDRVVRLRATTDPAQAGPCDLVVLATKAMHVEEAAAGARALLGPASLVVTIQNGLGSADRAARALPGAYVAAGVAGGFGASIVAPGHVRHEGWELVRFGERSGPPTEALLAAVRAWREAGFRIEAVDDLDRVVWEKLVCNAAFSGVCALLELTIGEVLASSDAFAVSARCAREAADVARARGVALGFDDAETHVRAFGERIPGARPSALLDLLAGRPSEIEVINGAIAPAARAVGLDAPANETVTRLVLAKEAAAGLREGPAGAPRAPATR